MPRALLYIGPSRVTSGGRLIVSRRDSHFLPSFAKPVQAVKKKLHQAPACSDRELKIVIVSVSILTCVVKQFVRNVLSSRLSW